MGLCEIRANLLKNGECPTRRLLAIHQSNYSQMQQQQKLYKHGHMTNGNTPHQTKLGSLWNECLRL